jgi:hypothetical protein
VLPDDGVEEGGFSHVGPAREGDVACMRHGAVS